MVFWLSGVAIPASVVSGNLALCKDTEVIVQLSLVLRSHGAAVFSHFGC